MFAPLWKLCIAPGGTGPFGGWSIILTGTALSSGDQQRPQETSRDHAAETIRDHQRPVETTGDQQRPAETSGDHWRPLETSRD